MNRQVLVLNNDYEPLNVCNMKRAILLVYLGKAEVLHSHENDLRSMSGFIMIPSVVKLHHHVKRPLPELKLSRRNIFVRDNYTCQYCGKQTRDLTLDHVIPKHKGGKSTWDNLVCCCKRCNSRKGGKMAEHTGMRLMKAPKRPKYIPFISMTKYIECKRDDIWRDYLPTFADIPLAAEVME